MVKKKLQKSHKSSFKKFIDNLFCKNSKRIFSVKFEKKVHTYFQNPKTPVITAILIFFGFFFLYLKTTPQFNVGYADSDELIAVAANLGIAHPPGYALYIFLLHLFMQLPFPGSVAFHAHVFSALLQSLSLVMVFLNINLLFSFYRKNKDYNPLIAFIANILTTIFLGTSFLFWLYSVVAEKYSLLVFMTAILTYLTLRLIMLEKIKLINFIYLGVLYALIITYHPTGLVLLPAILVLFWQKKWYQDLPKLIHSVLGFVVGAIFVVGLTLFLNSRDVNISWNFTPTLVGLWDNFTRKVFMPINNDQSQIGVYLSNFHMAKIFAAIPGYLKNLFSHWGGLGLGFMLLGLVYLFKNIKLRFNIGSSVFLSAILLPLYLGISDNPGTQGVIMRQYLLGYLLLSIPLSLGIYLFLKQSKKALKIILKPKVRDILYIITGLATILFLVIRIHNAYKDVNLHNFNFVHDFYSKMLIDLPKDSMLGCFSDSSCFSLLYLQQIEKVRPDVIILPTAYPLVAHYLNKFDNLHGFDYPKNPFRTLDYLTWNLGKRRVFVTDISSQYYQLLGLGTNFLSYVPYGYYGEIVRKLPMQIPKPQDYSFSRQLLNTSISKKDNMRIWNQMTIARLHMFNASNYIKIDDRDQAKKELDLMTDLLIKLPNIDPKQINSVRVDIETKHPSGNSKPGDRIQTVAEILDIANKFIEKKKYNKAYQGAVGALAIDPKNIKARLTLADIYMGQEKPDWAKLELHNVLKLDPNNASATAKLQKLN